MYDDRLVTTLEYMPDAAMLTIKMLGVDPNGTNFSYNFLICISIYATLRYHNRVVLRKCWHEKIKLFKQLLINDEQLFWNTTVNLKPSWWPKK